MTVGLIIGSVLVQETSLGAAYFRDPKVLASFAMWGVYVSCCWCAAAQACAAARRPISPAPSSS